MDEPAHKGTTSFRCAVAVAIYLYDGRGDMSPCASCTGADIRTTMDYVREAENMSAGFGEPFPALPLRALGVPDAAPVGILVEAQGIESGIVPIVSNAHAAITEKCFPSATLPSDNVFFRNRPPPRTFLCDPRASEKDRACFPGGPLSDGCAGSRPRPRSAVVIRAGRRLVNSGKLVSLK